MEKKKILIVEDEGLVALKIKKDLERMGYEVVNIFASGEETNEGIEAARPDLVLMDIKLQGKLDGIETANVIHEQYNVPVIYLTAHSEEETLRRAKKSEPYGYLLKPVNEKELHIAVEIALYKYDLDCKLRESEEQYRLLAENMGDVIWIFNIVRDRFTFVSTSVQRMRGFTPWQVCHQSMKDALSPESYELFTEGLRRRLAAFAAGDIFSTRIQTHYLDQLHKNGSLVPTEVVTTLMSNEEGQATELLGVSRDITLRKQAEEKLKKEKDFSTSIINGTPAIIFGIAPDGATTFINPAGQAITGFNAEELIGKNWWTIFYPGDEYRQVEQLFLDLKKGDARDYEMTLTTRDGQKRTISWNSLPSYDRDGNIIQIIGFGNDITERKKAEEELLIAHEQLELRVHARTMELNRSNKQLRNLAAHLQSVREEERMKIAREIHDELGQVLTAQKMDLSWFRDKYGDHKAIFDKAGAMLETLNETIRSVRRICTKLRPSILDDFGLIDAMQWQADEFKKRTRIDCAVDSTPEHIELDKDLSTALFRIFQETLTNVLKHSGATKVMARLIKNSDNIILEVIDNGKGITDEQLSKPQSFGLMGMRERVYPWGGKVEVTGHKNKGTKVKVTTTIPHRGNGPA